MYIFVENLLCSHHPPPPPHFVLWYSGVCVSNVSRWNLAAWFGYYLSDVLRGLGRLACCVTCVYASVSLGLCGVPNARRAPWRVTTKACGTLGIHSYALILLTTLRALVALLIVDWPQVYC